MISAEDRALLCELVDEMRMRGVHVIHIERADLKLEIHVNSTTPEGAVAAAVKARLLNDPNTPEEVKQQLREEQDEDELDADMVTGAG